MKPFLSNKLKETLFNFDPNLKSMDNWYHTRNQIDYTNSFEIRLVDTVWKESGRVSCLLFSIELYLRKVYYFFERLVHCLLLIRYVWFIFFPVSGPEYGLLPVLFF